MSELLSTADVARLYGVTPQTIRLWIRKGIIAYVEVGNSRLRRRKTIRIERTEAERHFGPVPAIAEN